MTFGTVNPIVYLNVTDRQRALAFYRDTLSLAVRESADYGDVLDLGGAALRLTVIPDHEAHVKK